MDDPYSSDVKAGMDGFRSGVSVDSFDEGDITSSELSEHSSSPMFDVSEMNHESVSPPLALHQLKTTEKNFSVLLLNAKDSSQALVRMCDSVDNFAFDKKNLERQVAQLSLELSSVKMVLKDSSEKYEMEISSLKEQVESSKNVNRQSGTAKSYLSGTDADEENFSNEESEVFMDKQAKEELVKELRFLRDELERKKSESANDPLLSQLQSLQNDYAYVTERLSRSESALLERENSLKTMESSKQATEHRLNQANVQITDLTSRLERCSSEFQNLLSSSRDKETKTNLIFFEENSKRLAAEKIADELRLENSELREKCVTLQEQIDRVSSNLIAAEHNITDSKAMVDKLTCLNENLTSEMENSRYNVDLDAIQTVEKEFLSRENDLNFLLEKAAVLVEDQANHVDVLADNLLMVQARLEKQLRESSRDRLSEVGKENASELVSLVRSLNETVTALHEKVESKDEVLSSVQDQNLLLADENSKLLDKIKELVDGNLKMGVEVQALQEPLNRLREENELYKTLLQEQFDKDLDALSREFLNEKERLLDGWEADRKVLERNIQQLENLRSDLRQKSEENALLLSQLNEANDLMLSSASKVKSSKARESRRNVGDLTTPSRPIRFSSAKQMSEPFRTSSFKKPDDIGTGADPMRSAPSTGGSGKKTTVSAGELEYWKARLQAVRSQLSSQKQHSR